MHKHEREIKTFLYGEAESLAKNSYCYNGLVAQLCFDGVDFHMRHDVGMDKLIFAIRDNSGPRTFTEYSFVNFEIVQVTKQRLAAAIQYDYPYLTTVVPGRLVQEINDEGWGTGNYQVQRSCVRKEPNFGEVWQLIIGAAYILLINGAPLVPKEIDFSELFK